MVRAKRRDSFPCPAIPAPGQQAVPVERAGQHIIRTDAREHTDSLDDVFRCLGCYSARDVVAAPAVRYARRPSNE